MASGDNFHLRGRGSRAFFRGCPLLGHSEGPRPTCPTVLHTVGTSVARRGKNKRSKEKKKKKKLTHFGESAYFQRRSVIANSRAGAGSGAPGDERQELLPTPCSPPGTRTSTGTALRSGHARDKSRNRALWLTHSPCRGLPMRRELPARVLPVLGGRGVTPESWWP